jgi:uncharacterized membrane protein
MADPGYDDRAALVSKTRLDFLFDGIFAIAMTILVLELKVPDLEDRHSTSELARRLLHHAPGFASYLLSFFMLGMFWASHNKWYRHIQRITKGVLALQLFQLAIAAFFPFCAALFGKYPTNLLSVVVYLGCVTTWFWTGALVWILAQRAGALAPTADGALYRRIRRGQLAGSLVTTFMFLLYLVMALTR